MVTNEPTIDTVVSDASGAGSLAQLEINQFLSLTCTSDRGLPQSQRELGTAMTTVLNVTNDDTKQSHIAVVPSSSKDEHSHAGCAGIREHDQNRPVSAATGHAGTHVPGGQHVQRQ